MSIRGYYDMVREAHQPTPEPTLEPVVVKACIHNMWREVHRDYIGSDLVIRHFKCYNCLEVREVSLNKQQAAGLPRMGTGFSKPDPTMQKACDPNSQGC